MEYVILSTDSEWSFSNDFHTASLTYVGSNSWMAIYWSGEIDSTASWIDMYNTPPEGSVGVRVKVIYEDTSAFENPTITFSTNYQDSEPYAINGDGSVHTIEWIYTPMAANEFVNFIRISTGFGSYYATQAKIWDISYIYNSTENCVWTDKIGTLEVCD